MLARNITLSRRSDRPRASHFRRRGETFKVRQATPGDRSSLVKLLNAAEPGCSPQTVWNIPWTWSRYQVMESSGGDIVASICLEDLEEMPATEIRGLAVDRRWRGHGLASELVRRAVSRGEERGRQTLCVTKGPEFFERVGFRESPPYLLNMYPWRRPSEDNKGRVCMAFEAQH